ncbi:phospholipid-transporting ATPase ABCA1-like [Conger conger]|uniref:phospholipid-transporting ATPase ABCA1-like n=1 Tax=Conger conger TaxID=82655 RepID=UPI002A5A6725|nr:phospholipid-transporting ATPase ABCA1-like [Conger conger]
MDFLGQLRLLLWKNFLLRRRQKVRLVVELVWPLFLFIILVWVRATNPPFYKGQCHYPNKAMPSAGVLPWLQGMMCNIDNPCVNYPTPGETPGQVNNFNSSILAGMLIELQAVISNESFLDKYRQLSNDMNEWDSVLQNSNTENGRSIPLRSILRDGETFSTYLKENLSISASDAESVMSARIRLGQAMRLSRDNDLKDVLCNGTALEFNSSADKETFQNISCALTPRQVNDTRDAFQRNTDRRKLAAAFPQAMGVNPIETRELVRKTAADLLPVLQEVSRLQNSILFNATDSLDFRSDMIGSINLLLCGKEAENNSTNSRNVSTSEFMTFTYNETETFCQNLVHTLENSPGLRYVWSTFRPLLQGKVLFTPDTVATRLIVKEANNTFKAIAMLKELADAWDVHGYKIWNFMQDSPQMNSLRALLSNPVFAPALNLQLSEADSDWTAESLANFLYNGPPEDRPPGMPANDWRDVYNSTSELLEMLSQFIGCLDLNKFEALPSETRLVEESQRLLREEKFWAGIVFQDLETQASLPPPLVKYKIRMDIDEVERTSKAKDRSWSPGARDHSFNDLRYLWGGFAYLQDMIDHGIVRIHTGKPRPLGVFAQQMPYPCFVDDGFIRGVGGMLPMFLVLAFMFTVCLTIKDLVYEKELRLKEVLRAVGVRNGPLWLSRFIENFALLAVPCVFMSVMLKYGKVLTYSDPSVIFVFLLVFCVATVMQCFFISVFFSKANLAAACGGLIYFVLYLPHVLCFAWREVMPFPVKLAVSLLSCVAFGYGCENFSRYEEQGIGIQWSNMGQSPEEREKYTFLVSIIMMLVDSVIYWLLTWYIENVFPGQFGIAKPWYFPFTASYWCGTSVTPDTGPDLLKVSGELNDYMEPAPPDMKAGVTIRNLVKIYRTGKKLAVDGLSADFYEDQITSFLGHNGAGKTTTMSILTGLFAPTSGTAFIDGKDIRTDMDSIRKHLGMCPQHNVLFNELTVEEHIYFYARLKGRSSKEVKSEMDQMIKDVGLPHKRKELAKNLSGGMQRKLSVAIAFVGGSKIVILDEPTAGVDPYARRGIWELLLKYKQGRTIILSTHHMDEADILGDRIAIISHGKMCCCGSSLFLKKCFGSGYYLTLVKAGAEKMSAQRRGITQAQLPQNQDPSDSCSPDEGIGSETGSEPDLSGVKAISLLLWRHVPEAVFLESIGQEVTYILPYTGARDGTFACLFKQLDVEMADLGIASYGISDTTLEEIFLKVAEDTGVDVEIPDKKDTLVRDWKRGSRESKRHSIANAGSSSENLISKSALKGKSTNRVEVMQNAGSSNGTGSRVITGWELIRRQFLALFIKRFHHARRSRKGLIAQVVLPAVFVCLSLIFSMILPPFKEYPSLELQPWMYGAPQNTFFSNDAPDVVEVSRVTDSLVNDPGFGTRCMENYTIPNLPCSANGSDWFTPPVHPSISDIFINGNWSMANPSPSCQCSTPRRAFMLPECPPGAGGLPPPQRVQNTTDTLQDLTGRNMTDFLLKTYEHSGKNRYGGISVGGTNSQVQMNESEISDFFRELKGLLISSQDNETDQIWRSAVTLMKELGTRNNVKVWFYNMGWHAVVSFLGVANNAILRGNLPAGDELREYGIATANHPLNLTKEQLSYVALATTSTDVVVSICVIFAMSFIPASFVLFLIQERVSKAKHLQFVSGVNPAVYWVANFAWDMCNYVVPCLIVIVIFLAFQQKAYVSPENLPALILLLVLYGWSITPMMYPASFVFSVPSTAYVVLTCVNLFIGINGSVATFVMELFDDENVTYVNDIVKQALLVFPHFCLGRGLIDMAKNQAMATLFSSFGEDRFQDPLGWDMVGKNLCAMSIQGAIMFTVTLLIQYKFFFKPSSVGGASHSTAEEDEDVARERARVQQGGAQHDLLRVCDLSKVYRKKKIPAVDRISVGIPAAECFGLLGINGAGKTTTFKMLTGDIAVSSGEAFLNGYSIRTQMRDVHQNMGYCPQFDAIDDLLTGREHLELYARLRGVPEAEVKTVAEWGIQKLGLVKYSNKSAGTYSGGNKRKLSTAMALIGCPPVVFLDEPTTGMDPKARRFLWDCILSVIKEGRSVILTSHSMEECEALCTRMAIMVNGQFKCLGSIQHLKCRFGEGYTVIVKVGGTPPALVPVETFMTDTFPGCVLKEKHHNTLQYQLPANGGALATVFSQFTTHQERLAIEDYSVSQTTLDQVFVSFARHQHDAEDFQGRVNPADVLADEVPMQPLRNPSPAEKV